MQTQTVFEPTLKTFVRQVNILTRANMKSRYRKTVAGFLWVIINPLVMYMVQSTIFSKWLKLGIPNYYLFLLSGLLPWIFIVQSLEMGTPILQWNGSLLKSYPTSPLVYITAQIVDNFVNFLAAFLLILIPLSFVESVPTAGFLMLPICLLFLASGTMGMVWFLATLQVFFRDTKFLLSFILSITYFVTPVFYPPEFVPVELRWLININPFYILIAPFRVCIYHFNSEDFVARIIPAAALAVLLPLLAHWFWERKKYDIYFHL